MQITKIQHGDFVEVRISGRLDGYWAEHLRTGLADVVREGGHQIRVNLSEVSFLSSAGIRGSCSSSSNCAPLMAPWLSAIPQSMSARCSSLRAYAVY